MVENFKVQPLSFSFFFSNQQKAESHMLHSFYTQSTNTEPHNACCPIYQCSTYIVLPTSAPPTRSVPFFFQNQLYVFISGLQINQR